MAYGQTGSGKTHTMLGGHTRDQYNINLDPHPEEGIIPRTARELFRSDCTLVGHRKILNLLHPAIVEFECSSNIL